MWIHDFLRDRRQKVVVNGQISYKLQVTSGVPQGSVLGPTLFLVYINDLPQQVSCDISLFADDTLIYQIVNSPADKQVFQKNIDSLEKWALSCSMPFNVRKCSVMIFNQTCHAPDASYTLFGTPLEYQYLCVILQSDLKFTKHIEFKTMKAKRGLGMIKRALYDAPERARLLAYTSLCRPHVEYASAVWDPAKEYLKYDLEMVQNSAVRFISSLKGRESVTEALKKLSLETLCDSRKTNRRNLLMRLLSSEENHSSLISSYDELMEQRPGNVAITRAAARGDPPTIYAKTSVYHNSFLPRTVRELKSLIGHH